jgi:hypothetical protein
VDFAANAPVLDFCLQCANFKVLGCVIRECQGGCAHHRLPFLWASGIRDVSSSMFRDEAVLSYIHRICDDLTQLGLKEAAEMDLSSRAALRQQSWSGACAS